MNKERNERHLDIPYPSEDRINRSVEYIVDMSMEKKSVISDFIKMVKTVPFTLLFNNRVTFLFIGFIYIIAILYVDMTNLYRHPRHYYQFITLLAPTAFVIGLIDIVNSKEHKVIELEMSTKYNFQQLAAYKVFILFVYSVLLNIIVSAITPLMIHGHVVYQKTISVFDSIMIMNSILLLISSVSLAILLRYTNRYIPLVMLSLWYAMVILSAFLIPHLFENRIWLTTGHGLAVVSGGILHVEQLRLIFSKQFFERGVV